MTAGALLADIGGTNARFALYSDHLISSVFHYRVVDFQRPTEAMKVFLDEVAPDTPIGTAVISVAGPVEKGEARLTNGPWRFSAAAIAAELGLNRVKLVNDFAALAHGVPYFEDDDLNRIGGGRPVPDAPAALIGPGTGLGVAGLVECDRMPLALTCEGGHVTMAPADLQESRVLDSLRMEFGHVSAERVLSGEGLCNLYRTLAKLAGRPAPRRTTAEITERALAGGCAASEAALEMFCSMLGTVAGNLALTLGARRGVFLAGGIVPRFAERLAASPFRRRFEEKGRFKGYLAAIPTYVVMRPDPCFPGLASLAEAAAGGLETRPGAR
jgi:glucokinase